jgi:Uncharacterized protein conserved in bacteria (DUF2252)
MSIASRCVARCVLDLRRTCPTEGFHYEARPSLRVGNVVEGQRILQSAPDVFLGWSHYDTEPGTTDFYVRQLWDGKASVTVDEMGPKALGPLLDPLRRHARPRSCPDW